MDMPRALEKLRQDFQDVTFVEIMPYGPAKQYGISADHDNFHFIISNQPSPMCAFRRMGMCCQAMK